MQLRKAFTNDLLKVKQIAQTVILHNYAPFLGLEATTTFIESGMSDKEIEKGIDSCIILEEKNDILAFAITKGDLLHLIMVDVPFQNTGYGETLLAYVEAAMFEKYTCIRLQTFKENHVAKRFYQKHGWQATEQSGSDDAMLQLCKQGDRE